LVLVAARQKGDGDGEAHLPFLFPLFPPSFTTSVARQVYEEGSRGTRPSPFSPFRFFFFFLPFCFPFFFQLTPAVRRYNIGSRLFRGRGLVLPFPFPFFFSPLFPPLFFFLFFFLCVVFLPPFFFSEVPLFFPHGRCQSEQQHAQEEPHALFFFFFPLFFPFLFFHPPIVGRPRRKTNSSIRMPARAEAGSLPFLFSLLFFFFLPPSFAWSRRHFEAIFERKSVSARRVLNSSFPFPSLFFFFFFFFSLLSPLGTIIFFSEEDQKGGAKGSFLFSSPLPSLDLSTYLVSR